MTHEQFFHWLQGFLDATSSKRMIDGDIIRCKLSEVIKITQPAKELKTEKTITLEEMKELTQKYRDAHPDLIWPQPIITPVENPLKAPFTVTYEHKGK